MITRILAASALSLAMFATFASAAPRSASHEEASQDNMKCFVGTYNAATSLCTVAGPATIQKNTYQTTADGRSHYEAAQDNMRCFVGAYDISTGECIVPGKGQRVTVLSAPESLGGSNASGNSIHNFN